MRLSYMLAVLMAALQSVFAAPPVNITVLYRYENNPDNHGIAAFDSTGLLIGYACNSTLNSGDFARHPIRIDTDRDAAGHIHVDGKIYPIHSKSEYSGGPTCSRIYNDEMSEINCSIAMPSDFKGTEVPLEQTHTCFGPDYAAFDLSQGIRRIDPSLAGKAAHPPSAGSQAGVDLATYYTSLGKRCITESETEPAQNISPHQQFWEEQLTVCSLLSSILLLIWVANHRNCVDPT